MRSVIVGLFILWLAGCAASAPRTVKVDRGSMFEQLALLPGVSVTTGDGVQFSYPGEAMFGHAAVLPLPGGTALLDPLAEFFLRYPDLSWKVEVRAQTEHGELYDQNLADKRSELLATYLLSKGVTLQRLDFDPQAAAGQPLVFTLKQPSQAAKE